MDSLQVANLKRGFFVGPRSEDEMVRAPATTHPLHFRSVSVFHSNSTDIDI